MREDATPLEAEQALLGAMLIDAGVVQRCGGSVAIDDFDLETHRRIYSAIGSVPVPDVVTVGAELQRRGHLESVGGLDYLTDLSCSVPATAMAPHYAGIVAERAMMRRLIAAGRQIATGAQEHEDAASALAAAEELLSRVRRGGTGQAVYLGSVIEQRWKQHRERGQRTEGWPTGFGDLDLTIGGLRAGELIVLGARPSAGKTAFALSIAARRAQTEDVLFVSLETGRAAVADRVISAGTGLSARVLRQKGYGDERLTAAEESVGRLMGLRLYLLDEGEPTTDRLAAEAWRLSADGHLGLVVVDYLTLLGDRKAKGETDAAHVGRMAQRLQRLAVSLGCPILLISQLSRDVEHRESHRPVLADLRDSGAIEQAASLVLLLYRPSYYGEKPDGQVEVIVAKQKDGPIGTVPLAFDLETGQFGDWTAGGAAPPASHPGRPRPRRRSMVDGGGD